MATNTEAKFSLVLDDQVSSAANSAGDSLDSLRQRIAGGEDAIKNMRAAFNRLRGSTDDVKAAKAELTAKLNAERSAISSASLQLLKSGTTYDSVAAKAKKLASEQDALKKSTSADKAKSMSSAIGAAGGPVSMLSGKLGALKDIAGGAGGKMGLLTFAAAGLIGAVVALAAAAASAAYSLAKFVVSTVDGERSANLLREAWSKSAGNAMNLGTQVDALAEKVPTSTEKLNELAIALMKSKLGGQATVDAFNAVGQASAALGDEAGGKIKEFIERGRMMGRFRIDPSEMLEGFGNLNFDDVAKALAKNMGTTVEAARLALRQGRVKLADGAKAMRDAVEQTFGDINQRKMMSIGGLSDQLQKKFGMLTRGINVDSLLVGLNKLVGLFDTSTQTGAALKSMLQITSTVMGKLLVVAMPFVEKFLYGLVLGALDAGIAVLKLRNWLVKTFGGSDMFKGIDMMNVALETGRIALGAVAGVLAIMAVGIGAAVVSFVMMYQTIKKVVDVASDAWDKLKGIFDSLDFAAVGKSIPDGLVDGLKMGAKGLFDGVTNLADETKKRFKTALGIASPSKVFAGYGENTAEGYAQGVDRGAPEAARAVDSMVTTPSGSNSASAKASTTATAGNVSVTFVYQAAAGASGDVASQVNESSVRAALVKIIQEANISRGVPVGT